MPLTSHSISHCLPILPPNCLILSIFTSITLAQVLITSYLDTESNFNDFIKVLKAFGGSACPHFFSPALHCPQLHPQTLNSSPSGLFVIPQTALYSRLLPLLIGSFRLDQSYADCPS